MIGYKDFFILFKLLLLYFVCKKRTDRQELTDFVKNNRNTIPWTEEEKNIFLRNCINKKLTTNEIKVMMIVTV